MNTVLPFGEVLQQLRKHRGLNQRGLAQKIHRHFATVSAWERSLYLPDCRDIVLDLAQVLDLPADETNQLLFAAQFPLLTKGERGATDQEMEAARRPVFPRYWNVPYPRNVFFTGRDPLLKQVYEFLHRSPVVVVTQMAQALCGLGGVGKTQVAVEYVYRHREEYAAVFWLKADTSESLLTDFLHLAVLLDLPERDARDQQRTLSAIKRWGRDCSRCVSERQLCQGA